MRFTTASRALAILLLLSSSEAGAKKKRAAATARPATTRPAATAPTGTTSAPTGAGSASSTAGPSTIAAPGSSAAPAETATRPTSTARPSASAPASRVPSASAVDLPSLRRELDALDDELFRSRAHAVTVAATARTQLVVAFEHDSARQWPIARLDIALDGRPLVSAAHPSSTAAIPVFGGPALAGAHRVSVTLEVTRADGKTTSKLAGETFFTVRAGHTSRVRLRARVDGEGAVDGPGRVELALRVDVAEGP